MRWAERFRSGKTRTLKMACRPGIPADLLVVNPNPPPSPLHVTSHRFSRKTAFERQIPPFGVELEFAMSAFSDVLGRLGHRIWWNDCHGAAAACRRSMARFGTWIGGDRDGHPGVTADVTRQALAALRYNALRLFARQLEKLAHNLPLSKHFQACRKPWTHSFPPQPRVADAQGGGCAHSPGGVVGRKGENGLKFRSTFLTGIQTRPATSASRGLRGSIAARRT